MGKKQWALLGNWSFIPGSPKGVTIYEYDSNIGKLSFKETVLNDLYAGVQCFDKNTNVDYVVNEIGNRRNEYGGGGYVVALKFNGDTGKVELINEKESLAADPSYISLDKSKKYLIVVHHTGYDHITRVSKIAGKYVSETLFDDAAVMLFRVNDDGSIGDICDVDVIQGDYGVGPHAMSHLHCVVPDPSGELFVVCDKGLDKIYTYKIDRENAKLKLVGITNTPDGICPRYVTFHPTLPIVYVNFERSTVVRVYQYDTKEGIGNFLCERQTIQDLTVTEGIERVESSDIIFNEEKQVLYTCIRGVNIVSVMKVNDVGEPTLVQNISACGDPRGLTLAPDGRFMFSCNMMAGTISTFAVNEDGTLNFRDNDTKGASPACLVII